MVENTPSEKPEKPTKNPVKRVHKVHTSIYMARAMESVDVDKYTWACLNCGRIWLMRQDAERCRHTDVVWYGIRPIRCWGRMSREELEEVRRKRKLPSLPEASN